MFLLGSSRIRYSISSQGPGSLPVVVVIMEVVVITSQSMEPIVHFISIYSGVHISWDNHCIYATLGQILNEPLIHSTETNNTLL